MIKKDPVVAIGALLLLFLGSVYIMFLEIGAEPSSILKVFGFSVMLGVVYFILVLGLLLPPNRYPPRFISDAIPDSPIKPKAMLGLPLVIFICS
jgi:hypothetical protein